MDKDKSCKKRLCDAGISGVFFSLVAFIISIAGCAIEPLSIYIHKSRFGIDKGLFGIRWNEYIMSYSMHIISFIFTFMVFIICFNNCHKKKIGAETGIIITLLSFVMSSISGIFYYNACCNDMMDRILAMSIPDETSPKLIDFDRYMMMAYYLLPAISCGILFICGLNLCVRLLTASFTVRSQIMKCQPLENIADYDGTDMKIHDVSEYKDIESVILDSKENEISNEKIEKDKFELKKMICNKCFEESPLNTRFCNKCGNKLIE